MPMQRQLYPKNWDAIARRTKQTANWHCQDCDRPCLLPGEDLLDFWFRLNWPGLRQRFAIAQIQQAIADSSGQVRSSKATRFILTTAHLDHNPPNVAIDNLRALCSVCHCRMDLQAMALKRRAAAARTRRATQPVYPPRQR